MADLNDWICRLCGLLNLCFRSSCARCRSNKPLEEIFNSALFMFLSYIEYSGPPCKELPSVEPWFEFELLKAPTKLHPLSNW
mmetsp:Transcript_6514/g.9667  ORF Transcript_6514/g.9667 Transcript_6514/m.9667 type:complete len:82 (-) Transcript_6514:7-252(-)